MTGGDGSSATTRELIDERVRESPGVHFSRLVRDLDLATGQVQYHLRRLEQRGRVVAADVRGRTHYFPPSVDPADRRAIALLRRETARDVLATVVERGTSTPAAVADDLEVARSTLEYHLDGLVAEDLVRKAYDADGRVTLHPGDRDRVARALAAVSPTLPERLVDRFARLVDRLLAGE